MQARHEHPLLRSFKTPATPCPKTKVKALLRLDTDIHSPVKAMDPTRLLLTSIVETTLNNNPEQSLFPTQTFFFCAVITDTTHTLHAGLRLLPVVADGLMWQCDSKAAKSCFSNPALGSCTFVVRFKCYLNYQKLKARPAMELDQITRGHIWLNFEYLQG